MRNPVCSICHFKDEKIGFYSFPSNPARLKSWLESLKIEKKPAANAKVCFQHFDKKKIRWSRHEGDKNLKKTTISQGKSVKIASGRSVKFRLKLVNVVTANIT